MDIGIYQLMKIVTEIMRRNQKDRPMQNKQHIALKSILTLIFLTNIVFANWTINTGVDREYNTNPFRYISPVESWSTLIYADVYTSLNAGFLGYSGQGETFDNISDRNYYWHKLQYYQNKELTRWGANVSQRFRKSDFSEYNYITVAAHVNHKFPTEVLSLYFYGKTEGEWYTELPEYDNIYGNIGLRLHKTFATRTTVILSGFLNYTHYLTPVAAEETTEMGSGRWRNTNMNTEFYPSITQRGMRLRLAQSVFRGTGIAMQYDVRGLFENNDWSDIGVSGAYADLALWDDPAHYRGYSVGAELTQLLPWSVTMKVAGYKSEKDYIHQIPYVAADSLDYDSYRSDKAQTVWISLEKTFQSEKPVLNGFSLSLRSQWTDNSSNSYWYNYTMRYTSLGINYQF